jgi:hypothetical protein
MTATMTPGGAMPKPTRRSALTLHDIADIRAALDRAQAFARAHGDDFRLAFRKADRRLIVSRLQSSHSAGEAERRWLRWAQMALGAQTTTSYALCTCATCLRAGRVIPKPSVA